MATWGYEVLSALEDKICIPARACNILYLFSTYTYVFDRLFAHFVRSLPNPEELLKVSTTRNKASKYPLYNIFNASFLESQNNLKNDRWVLRINLDE